MLGSGCSWLLIVDVCVLGFWVVWCCGGLLGVLILVAGAVLGCLRLFLDARRLGSGGLWFLVVEVCMVVVELADCCLVGFGVGGFLVVVGGFLGFLVFVGFLGLCFGLGVWGWVICLGFVLIYYDMVGTCLVCF